VDIGPTVGWCRFRERIGYPSERAGNRDQLVYCESHAYRRRQTIRLLLARRMRPGEQPERRK
jgi:hypothetical protein